MPYRTANGPGAYGIGAHTGAVLSPDGRFLAVTTVEGYCALVDPTTGAELAKIRRNRTMPFAFEASGALLTCGSAGLFRWPVKTEPGKSLCRVGQPESLFPSNRHDDHASSADGRVVVMANYQHGALLLRRDHPGPPLVLGPQEDARNCAISPDGRWVATGNHSNSEGIGAKIWDAADGKLVKNLPISQHFCRVGFSPDGKWLLTTAGECRLWEVGTWEEKLALGKTGAFAFAFSRDSRVLALEGEPGAIRLVDPTTGREYVRLDAPEQSRLWPVCFTPDGAQLICLGADSKALHVWDLRAIRHQLKTLNLDWDAPEYEPESPPQPPLRIEVIQK